MSYRRILIVWFIIFSFCFTGTLAANEFQRRLFFAGGALGVVTARVEISGWNNQVASNIRNAVNQAVSSLQEVMDLWSDPPYDRTTIDRLIRDLRNYNARLSKSNARAARAYFHTIGSNLALAVSVIFNNKRGGLMYEATCDTFVVNAGFHMGRIQVYATDGDMNRLAGAKSSVSQAINGGVAASHNLKCGFPSLLLWNALRINEIKTREEANRIINEAAGLIAAAIGISSPDNVIPSSGGQSNENGGGDTKEEKNLILDEEWADTFGNTYNFRKFGNQLKGYFTKVNPGWKSNLGYRKGELAFDLSQISKLEYSGRWLNRYKEQNGSSRSNWVNIKFVYEPDYPRIWVIFSSTSRRFLYLKSKMYSIHSN